MKEPVDHQAVCGYLLLFFTTPGLMIHAPVFYIWSLAPLLLGRRNAVQDILIGAPWLLPNDGSAEGTAAMLRGYFTNNGHFDCEMYALWAESNFFFYGFCFWLAWFINNFWLNNFFYGLLLFGTICKSNCAEY